MWVVQSEAARAEAEAAEKRRWSFLEVDEARDEETAHAGLATQVGHEPLSPKVLVPALTPLHSRCAIDIEAARAVLCEVPIYQSV